MGNILDVIVRLLGFTGEFQPWVRIVLFGWLFVTAGLVGSMVVGYKRLPERQPEAAGVGNAVKAADGIANSGLKVAQGVARPKILIPKTVDKVMISKEVETMPAVVQHYGDRAIDKVRENLAKLEQDGGFTDSELNTALKPLFSRLAFAEYPEENWDSYFYAVCATRIILQEVAPLYREAVIRRHIENSILILAKMQTESATIYGPAFSPTSHIDRYLTNKTIFLDKLPTRSVIPDEHARREIVGRLRAELDKAGLLTS